MHSGSSSKAVFAFLNMLTISFCFPPLISSMVRFFKLTDPCVRPIFRYFYHQWPIPHIFHIHKTHISNILHTSTAPISAWNKTCQSKNQFLGNNNYSRFHIRDFLVQLSLFPSLRSVSYHRQYTVVVRVKQKKKNEWILKRHFSVTSLVAREENPITRVWWWWEEWESSSSYHCYDRQEYPSLPIVTRCGETINSLKIRFGQSNYSNLEMTQIGSKNLLFGSGQQHREYMTLFNLLA